MMMDEYTIQHQLGGRLDDPLWRLHHLYWIENKEGFIQHSDTTCYGANATAPHWVYNAV